MHDKRGTLAQLCLNKERKFAPDFQLYRESIMKQVGIIQHRKPKEDIDKIQFFSVMFSQSPQLKVSFRVLTKKPDLQWARGACKLVAFANCFHSFRSRKEELMSLCR